MSAYVVRRIAESTLLENVCTNVWRAGTFFEQQQQFAAQRAPYSGQDPPLRYREVLTGLLFAMTAQR